jgi:two-component sensor histidine kinase/tetratricopeptide (TPR) repeat protein
MAKIALAFLFLILQLSVFAQTFEQFQQLYKKEKNQEQKAYYALVLSYEKQPTLNKEYEKLIKRVAKKSRKIRIVLKARKISQAVVSNYEIPEFQEIQSVKKELKEFGYADFYDNISICEAYILGANKNFSKASIQYDQLYKKIKKTFLTRKTEFLPNQNYNLLTMSIAFHYFSVGETEKAVDYLNDLIRYTDVEKNANEYASILNNTGTAFLSSKKYDKALWYYQKADVIYKKEKNKPELDWNTFCMALTKHRSGNSNDALQLIQKLELKSTVKGPDYTYVEWELVEMLRAEILLNKNEIKVSGEILNRILSENREGALNDQDWTKLYKLLYVQNKKSSDSKKALYFHEKWAEQQEKSDKLKKEDNVNLQLRFLELEKSRIQDKYEKKALRREKELRFQNEIKLFSLLALVIIVIFYFLIRSIKVNKRLKKLNRINELNVNKIISSLSEKEVMIKEIHHRVKNNFQIISSLLNIQASAIDDPKYAEPLLEAKNRVHSMSLIHQKMYSLNNNYVSIDFKIYIEELLDSLLTSFGREDLKLEKEIHIDKLKISLEKAVPIGLFCNEVFTNSYKYAVNEKNELKMEISINKQGDNEVLLRIKDSGPGFSDNVNQKKSIGHQLKIILSEQLDGVLTEYNDNGAVVELKFKV